MELEINNFINYLTNTYANYIDTIHNFVPASYKSSMTGEFGGLNTKYARILIVINRRSYLESYYKRVQQSVDIDLIKKQIGYNFLLVKETGLLDQEQFNNFLENLLKFYSGPMYRVESLFRKCKFASHKDSRIGDEFDPLNYREYSQITNPLRNNENLISEAYLRYITKWPEENIEYIHSFISLEDFEDIQSGDILGVKDYNKPDKLKIMGNVNRPTSYFDVDWRTN